MTPKRHFADYWCESILNKYPGIIAKAKVLTSNRGKLGDAWPNWCEFPAEAILSLLMFNSKAKNKSDEASTDYNELSMQSLYAALVWMQTKTVYRFDPDLFKELSNSTEDDGIPTEILLRLPFKSVFVEVDIKMIDQVANGFFAWLNYDPKLKAPELHLHFIDKSNNTLPLVLPLNGGSVSNSIKSYFKRLIANTDNTIREISEMRLSETGELVSDMATSAVNALLYLCADNTDLIPRSSSRRDRPGHIPKEHSTWDVGVRIGAALRKYRDAPAESTLSRTVEDRHAPRPHMRRAHWHHYWTGPRTGERKLILRWLHPVLVGTDGDLPTVVHLTK
jgi:hypothetical protein